MIPPAVRLKVKYGLVRDPTDEQMRAWELTVQRLLAAGVEAEVAGRSAAIEHFEGVEKAIYYSAADNIAALLKALAAKS